MKPSATQYAYTSLFFALNRQRIGYEIPINYPSGNCGITIPSHMDYRVPYTLFFSLKCGISKTSQCTSFIMGSNAPVDNLSAKSNLLYADSYVYTANRCAVYRILHYGFVNAGTQIGLYSIKNYVSTSLGLIVSLENRTPLNIVEGKMGVEPITQRLTAACSAIELHPHSAFGGTRNRNSRIKSAIFCQLSYKSKPYGSCF